MTAALATPIVAQAWTVGDVGYRLNEAAMTLHRMPMNRRDWPEVHWMVWPAVVRSAAEVFDSYGRRRAVTRPAAPAPENIRRMDEAVLWLLWLDDLERKITWARAEGYTWRELEDIDGRCHVTLRKVVRTSHERIVRKLVNLSVPVDP
jgi:Domain of unknown function (DUF6362)